MFKKIKSILRGLKDAIIPNSAEKENVKPVRKRDKKRPANRRDPNTYVRKADIRTPAPKRPVDADAGKTAKNSSKRSRSEKRRRAAGTGSPADAVPKTEAVPKTPDAPPPPIPPLNPPPPEPGKIRFCDLEVTNEILGACQTLGFQYCTPIQAKCLPYALAGRDLAAKAQTGTGKTAAFLCSCISRLQRNPLAERKNGAPRVLVLAPTRELAIQIHNDALGLLRYANLKSLVVFGGMDHEKQRRELDAVIDILIGTPGRIIDYTRSRDLDLSRVEILVIDEADRMLDMGFIPDVRRIVWNLPHPGERQTMLFSATLEPRVLSLVESWMVDPAFVEDKQEHIVTDLIEQRFYAVLDEQKLAFLLHLIRTEKPERMIVFGNRKDKNRALADKLYVYGCDAELLSGDVPQEKRLKILDRFRSGQTRILVATDVAARGIHVDGITHVVNYDLPEQADDYVHRVGRTGRAGEKGQSISFVCEYGAFALPEIEKYAKMEVKTIQPQPEELVLPEPVREAPPREKARAQNGGSRDRRPPRRRRS